MTVETVSEAFVSYLESTITGLTFGTNIFLSKVSSEAPDTCYWVITSGGSPVQKLRSGEMVKQYFVTINYRSIEAKKVEKRLFELEEMLNCAGCVELEGFEVVDIQASQFPVDEDFDNEERRVGFVQANIKIYKKEC